MRRRSDEERTRERFPLGARVHVISTGDVGNVSDVDVDGDLAIVGIMLDDGSYMDTYVDDVAVIGGAL